MYNRGVDCFNCAKCPGVGQKPPVSCKKCFGRQGWPGWEPKAGVKTVLMECWSAGGKIKIERVVVHEQEGPN